MTLWVLVKWGGREQEDSNIFSIKIKEALY